LFQIFGQKDLHYFICYAPQNFLAIYFSKGAVIGRYFIIKNAKKFSEHNAKKFRLKIPHHYRDIVKKTKLFYSVMTSLSMFAQSQNFERI